MLRSDLSASNLRLLPSHVKMIQQAAGIEDTLNLHRNSKWKSDYPRFENLIERELMYYQEQILHLTNFEKWKLLNEKEWAFDLLSSGSRSQWYNSMLEGMGLKKAALLKLAVYYLKDDFEEHYGQPFAAIPFNVDGKMTIMEMETERFALEKLLK